MVSHVPLTTWLCSQRLRSSLPSTSAAGYQETATPEVSKRLTEITVDPKTVVVTDPTKGKQ